MAAAAWGFQELWDHLSICSGTFGVDDTFWNTLSVEVGKQVYQVKVLEQKRTWCWS